MSSASLPAWIDPPEPRPLGGPKAERARDILRKRILFRIYAPGEHLLEQPLAQELGCSQGTVREALLKLGEDGLVARRGYRGTIVTETTLAAAAEMVRVRLSIERTVAGMLVAQGLGEGRAEIDRLLGEMDAAHLEGDLDRCSVLDRVFHAALARAAGMELLCPVLHRCALHIHRFTLGGLEVPREFFQEAGLGDEHRTLLETVLAGGPARAGDAMALHLAQVLRRWAPSLLEAAGRDAFRGRA